MTYRKKKWCFTFNSCTLIILIISSTLRSILTNTHTINTRSWEKFYQKKIFTRPSGWKTWYSHEAYNVIIIWNIIKGKIVGMKTDTCTYFFFPLVRVPMGIYTKEHQSIDFLWAERDTTWFPFEREYVTIIRFILSNLHFILFTNIRYMET